MKDLVTFGEGLLRFSTARGNRFSESNHVDFYVGGTELNIAANYKSLGGEARWVSVLPSGPGGDIIADKVQALGLPSSTIKRAHGPLGFYLLEPGVAPRGDIVSLRQKSLFCEHVKGWDWDDLLKGAGYFHSSGVTAGLGALAREELLRALAIAKSKNMLVSYDCNFRQNLWTMEQAKAGQKEILSHLDILFSSRAEIADFFGKKEPSEVIKKQRLQYLILTKRDDSAKTYAIEIYTPDSHVISQSFAFETLDRIGVGDSMAAGFFAGLGNPWSLQEIADFAAACGALKYATKGDMALLKKGDVERLLKNGAKSITR